MSETWTEYAVRWPNGMVTNATWSTRESAEKYANQIDVKRGYIVGRTVTASDWLPVDTDGAK